MPRPINYASRSVHPMPLASHTLAHKGLRQAPMAGRPSGHLGAFIGQFMRGKGHLAHWPGMVARLALVADWPWWHAAYSAKR
jgi:hypothetical protein